MAADTPPGWTHEKGPLPTIMWAYPREFKDKASTRLICVAQGVLVPPQSLPSKTLGQSWRATSEQGLKFKLCPQPQC